MKLVNLGEACINPDHVVALIPGIAPGSMVSVTIHLTAGPPIVFNTPAGLSMFEALVHVKRLCEGGDQ